MPTLSGSAKAPLYSIAGTTRAGATRSGYFVPHLALTIGGTSRKQYAIQETLQIEEVLDEQPNTLRVTVRVPVSGGAAWSPSKGQEIIVGIGNITNRVFAGRILSRRAVVGHVSDTKLKYELDCVDYQWDLDHLVVWGQDFTGVSASAIASSLMSTYAAARGFGAGRVQPGLASIDFRANHGETLSACLTRLAKMVGAFWYIDYNKTLHFYSGTEADGNTVTLNSANQNWWDLAYDDDLSQARTRAWAIGGSSTTTAVVANGATTVAVDDTRLFGASGGYAAGGGNLFTYTGKSATSGPGNLTGCALIGVAMAQGEQITVVERRTDTSGATALAAILGGGHDGIVEHPLQDGSLGSSGLQAAGDADLALFPGSGEKRITYKTRDQFTKAGKTIPVSITTPISISASFLVQKVTLTGFEIGAATLPTRDVEAGVSKRELIDVTRPFAALGLRP